MIEFLSTHPIAYWWLVGALGFFASLTHAFRLITYWQRLSPLLQTWGVAILGFSVLCSVVQARAIQAGIPPDALVLAIAVVQAVVIVAALTFPWLFARPIKVRAMSTPLAHSRR